MTWFSLGLPRTQEPGPSQSSEFQPAVEEVLDLEPSRRRLSNPEPYEGVIFEDVHVEELEEPTLGSEPSRWRLTDPEPNQPEPYKVEEPAEAKPKAQMVEAEVGGSADELRKISNPTTKPPVERPVEAAVEAKEPPVEAAETPVEAVVEPAVEAVVEPAVEAPVEQSVEPAAERPAEAKAQEDVNSGLEEAKHEEQKEITAETQEACGGRGPGGVR